MKTEQWMRLWKVVSDLLGRKVWHYLTNNPSGGQLLKLFTSRNSFTFMHMNDASTRNCKKKKIFIFQMSWDGSDQKLWMSLILSKMEQREQIKNAAYCKLQESECSTLIFEWYLKINFSKSGLCSRIAWKRGYGDRSYRAMTANN